jgi:hypothetical protein
MNFFILHEISPFMIFYPEVLPKQPLESPVKIWQQSNDWNKSYGPFELLFWYDATIFILGHRHVPLVYKYIF